MRGSDPWSVRWAAIWAIALVATGVLGDEILATTGFTNCDNISDIIVDDVDIKYDNSDKTLTFNVGGTSTKQQNVKAKLTVTAFGEDAYANEFDPCAPATLIKELCPVPSGHFGAIGTQPVEPEFADKIPAIAFQIPDISAQAKLELISLDGQVTIGCVQAQVTNGKTVGVPGLSYVAAGIAASALAVGGASAVSGVISGGTAGAGSSAGGVGTISPTFGEVFGAFHGFALNGMMSVQLPQVYRQFSKTFAFSTGLIPWTDMQIGIDNFRAKTGGNLNKDSVERLQKSMLVFPDDSTSTTNGSLVKRTLGGFATLALREVDAQFSSSTNGTNSTESLISTTVRGIRAFANTLAVPASNTFMTVLEIVAAVIAAIILGILLVKAILEVWALFGRFPESLSGFRTGYWGSIARTVTSLILLLYGVWVLYCVFQFTHGDSWAAQILAGVTLALFTGVLAFFSWEIWRTAERLKNTEGDTASLYEDRLYWEKYSLFYESYKQGRWWLFIPAIVYLFVKGTVLAATDGHGMIQTVLSLIVEGLFLILLVWSRPYERKSGNVLNITIQTVRVLSAALILVFVEEFGIAQTTQTVAGIALIAVQSSLAAALAILILWNAMISILKKNPHEKRRELKKSHRDTLTSLDARNSLLLMMDPPKRQDSDNFSYMEMSGVRLSAQDASRRGSSPEWYLGTSPDQKTSAFSPVSDHRDSNMPAASLNGHQSRDNLIAHAAPTEQEPKGGDFGESRPYQGKYGPGGGFGSYKAPSIL